MSKSYLGYRKIQEIINCGELPTSKDLYQDDILEILKILYGEEDCRACGKDYDLTIDHIIPKSLYGSSLKLNNLQILCSICNQIKADQRPGKNGWWPNSLKRYLSGGSYIWNAAERRYEDDPGR